MQLQLRLFGAFQAAIDDRPIPGHHWRRTAPRSLLQYLATRRSRYATADELMETFWADLPLENAKSSLQVAVSRLRSILRSALPLGTPFGEQPPAALKSPCPRGLPPDPFIRFTGTGYQLESTSIDLLDLFQQGPQLRQLAIPEPTATLVKLEMIDLPDAADLLPEHPYADWAETTRKQAQAELSALYLLRADLRTQAKRYPGALADLRYVLQREPTRESVALKAMHLAAALGDRAAALALFHQCSTALAEELGLDPTPELITLHTQLLREEVAVGALMAEPEPPRAAHRSNLPANLSSFVGREADLEGLAALLAGDAPHRLVTLSGPGGSGKTRLALEVARALASRFPDGICMVELAELRDGSLLAKTVAAALELQGAPSQSPLDLLRSYLGAKRLLLILDNCEHLLKAVAGLVEQLLHAAPHLQLLATSRQSLGLMGEVIWPVMPLPPPLGVQLFIDRAVSALPHFVATPENARYIEQICRCLDGIPLAIELAAARIRLLPVREIAHRLRDRFHFLSYGLPALGARHHSLRAALDWSYELLAEPERILFRRLGLFAGSFGLEAAESICFGPELEPTQLIDLLHSLVDKSLVVADLDSFPARFKLLETLRTYAAERLTQLGEAEEGQRHHLRWWHQLALQAEDEMLGGEQITWYERIDAELENLRLSLDWAERSGEHLTGLKVALGLWRFWVARNHGPEGSRYLALFLERARSDAPPALVAKALTLSAGLCLSHGAIADSRRLAAEACEVARTLESPFLLAQATGLLGTASLFLGDGASAVAHLRTSLALAESVGDEWTPAEARLWLGLIAWRQGDLPTAEALLDSAYSFFRRRQDLWNLALVSSFRARVAVQMGAFDQSRLLLAETLSLYGRIRDKRLLASALTTLARLEMAEGRPAEAVRLLGMIDAYIERSGTTIATWAEWVRQEHEEVRTWGPTAMAPEAYRRAYNIGWSADLAEAVEPSL